MTETMLDASEGTGDAKPHRRSSKARAVFFVLFFVLLGAVGATCAAVYYDWSLPFAMPKISSPENAKVSELQARLEQVEARLASMEAKQPQAANAARAVAAIASADNMDDLQKLKEGLVSVSGLLVTLQAQMTQTTENTKAVDTKAQLGLASILAFTQMQSAALAGHPFEEQRQALRKLIGPDEAAVTLLLKLEPLALQGVATPEALRDLWREESTAAQTAMRKAAAQTWQDRIVVALEGLVSVRALKPKPGETLSSTSIDLDLGHSDVAAALAKVNAMPPEAQEAAKEWRAKAQARVDLEQTLKAMVAHLIDRGDEPAQPPHDESAGPAVGPATGAAAGQAAELSAPQPVVKPAPQPNENEAKP